MKKLWMLLWALLVTGAVLVSCQAAGNSGETDTDPMTDAVTETEVATDPVAETETETETEADNFLIGGEPLQNYTVIYAADATASQLTAIRDMIDLVAGATGVTLPMLPDTQTAEREIVVGVTNRDTDLVRQARGEIQNDGYAMLVEDGRLYITGSMARGTVNGIYSFLHDYVGARFYAPGYTVLREDGLHHIPEDLYKVHSPVFVERNTYYQDSLSYSTYALRTRICNSSALADVPDMAGGELYYRGGAVHNLSPLAERGSGPTDIQPCLSDEAVYETVLKNVCAALDKDPKLTVFSVSQNDNPTYCSCEACAAFDEAHGSPSASLMNFVNRIAEAVEERYPDRNIKILTLAYVYSAKPPVDIVMRDNVVVQLCTMNCCFNHAFNDPACEKNAEFVEDLATWSRICHHLYLWDYNVNFSNEKAVGGPDLLCQWENFQVLRDNHVVGLFDQMWSCKSSEFGELRGYLASHLMWDPDITKEAYEKLIAEFMEDYYGAAGAYLWEYLELINDVSRIPGLTAWDGHTSVYTDWSVFYAPKDAEGRRNYDYIDRIVALWDAAEGCDLTDEQRSHVEQASIQYYGAMSNCARTRKEQHNAFVTVERLFKKYVYNGGDSIPDTKPKDDPAAPSRGLVFTSNGDGTCYVTGIGSCKDAELVIPAVSPDGDRVVGVGMFAFARELQLTSITVPEGVTHIAEGAFMACTSVTTVRLPDSVTHIGFNAFNSCSALSDLTLGAGLTRIDGYAFIYCASLTEVALPHSVIRVGEYAFASCKSLRRVTLGGEVEFLSRRLFSGSKGITEIVYDGTVAEWEALPRVETWDNAVEAYTVVCTDGSVTRETPQA